MIPRSTTYQPAREMRGSTSRTRWRWAWYSSLSISPTDRLTARASTNGLAKNRTYAGPGPRPPSGPFGAGPAHHHERGGGVAGEHRRDGRPAAGEEPLAGGEPLLDQRGVLGVVGHDEPAEVTVPPAERGDLRRVAVQQAGLARGRGRRDPGPPVLERVPARAHPALDVRREPRLDGLPEHRRRHAVQLHDEHPGRRAARRRPVRARPRGEPAAAPAARGRTRRSRCCSRRSPTARPP